MVLFPMRWETQKHDTLWWSGVVLFTVGTNGC